jgi:Family of unknown function (DUF6152)
MMMKRVLWTLVLVGVVATGRVAAHHSYAAYDTTRLVEIEGVVEDFQMLSPHSLLKVKDDNGRVYTFEWLATNGMRRLGIEQDTIKKGERLVASGHARRDFDESSILNCKLVKRMSDGRTWGRPPQ